MPSLEDIRRWLSGEHIQGLPERDDPDDEIWKGGRPNKALVEDCPACQGEGELPISLNGDVGEEMCPRCDGLGYVKRATPAKSFTEKMKDKHRQTRRGGKYRISHDGGDAILLFGQHNGSQVSDLATNRDGRDYLRWITTQDFPAELKDMARQWHNWGVEKYEHGSMKGKKI